MKNYYILILFLLSMSCSRPSQVQESDLSEVHSNVQISGQTSQCDNYDADAEDLYESEIKAHLDSWYKNFPSVLKNIKTLMEQRKYEEAITICESDSIRAIESLFDRWLENTLFFPEFSGLSEESSKVFRNNASEERIKFLELKTDLYEKRIPNERDSSLMRNYIMSLDKLAKYYYSDGDLVKSSQQMNKALNLVAKIEGELSLPYATILFNQAMLYKEIGNKAMALKGLQESKKIYEHVGMKNSEEWQNCVDLIQEIQ